MDLVSSDLELHEDSGDSLGKCATATTGTYYVWIRGYALDSGSDSVWIGLDGTEVGHLDEGGTYNKWFWSDNAGSGVNTIHSL